MYMEEYGNTAITTLSSSHGYGEIDAELMSQVLGLVGESGEIAEKFKKLVRDKQGVLSQEDKDEIIKELGDVLWYVNAVAHLLGSSIEEVARKNLGKVLSRKQRGKIQGSGDNR